MDGIIAEECRNAFDFVFSLCYVPVLGTLVVPTSATVKINVYCYCSTLWRETPEFETNRLSMRYAAVS